MTGLFLKKVGMMQVFLEDGTKVPVTVLQKDVCRVVSQKSLEKDGYRALCVGVGPSTRRLSKPLRGVFAKAKVDPSRCIKEIRLSDDAAEVPSVGDDLSVTMFSAGDMVDVAGRSKGNGFAGVIKRHNFSGMRASHGVSVSHRAHGSTGQNQDPGRVFKGKKMAGQCGNKQVTVQNLKVYSVDEKRHVVLVQGAVPGSRNQYVMLKKAVKS